VPSKGGRAGDAGPRAMAVSRGCGELACGIARWTGRAGAPRAPHQGLVVPGGRRGEGCAAPWTRQQGREGVGADTPRGEGGGPRPRRGCGRTGHRCAPHVALGAKTGARPRAGAQARRAARRDGARVGSGHARPGPGAVDTPAAMGEPWTATNARTRIATKKKGGGRGKRRRVHLDGRR
jgi:hypothetical protein